MSGMQKGFVQVYTGNGKGKTTAALGLVVRAAGAGYKTYFAQFMKSYNYSELVSLKKLSEWITIEQFGDDSFVFKREKPSRELIKSILNGIKIAEQNMLSGKYDLIVLDEICVSIYFGLISIQRVIDLINKKPENVELILTGRYCPEEILKTADLVTEMKEVKHYYNLGITSRKGIES